ncbi:MAG TPA: glycoside hydrolase family 2 protein [Dongiaceae bacterium]|nr:glycoside hydrolase family 2 protein [Dongiaceae bacterium]
MPAAPSIRLSESRFPRWLFLIWLCLLFGAVTAPAAELRQLSLDGLWQVAATGSDAWLPATVPGCIHTDLLAAGKIPDPFYRDNEKLVQWVGETNWTYRRTFVVAAADLTYDRVLLRCEGLDTLADLTVNGQHLAHTDNMFRTWEYDVKPLLHAGENAIEIAFTSPLPYMKEQNTARKLYEWSGPHEPTGRAWVRKEPCNFGWDWGPVLITCGIWRNIELVMFDTARLDDVLIQQDHSRSNQVGLSVTIGAETVRREPLQAAVSVRFKNKNVASATINLDRGQGRAELVVTHPQLWWPAGLGKQPLYDVQVELRTASGTVLDHTTKRIGLRTVQLLPGDKEHSLRFAVNGVPFFAKGANWIPADPFPNRVTPAELRRYVADAVAVNMNSMRLWGGGYYEEDALYDACDEMGLLVWTDMKFACSSYPAFDPAFMENVRQEIRDNVRRLRQHPCIGVWCGNNEISLMVKDQWSDESMGRADYDKLFRELIGTEVHDLDPQANYVPGSPEVGDQHYWQVWHGGKPFSAYRTQQGFMSEFGFQSFPEPRTVDAYTAPEDRTSLLSPAMDWHQRSAGNGNKKIQDMTAYYFNAPKDFDSALWLSQILQGYGIKTGAEFWREHMPQSMGCIFWQYNDCWPVASWSSVDYYGRWKALQYMARHFYAPLLVSGLEDATNRTVQIFVTSDELKARAGKVTWKVTDPAGHPLLTGSASLTVPAQQSLPVKLLDLSALADKYGVTNLLTWLQLEVAGKKVSDNLVLLAPPKDVKLVPPQLQAKVRQTKQGFQVTLTAAHPALWTWLSLAGDAKYSDNFVHVAADAPVKILVTPAQPMTKAEFTKALQVRSLIDTYTPVP